MLIRMCIDFIISKNEDYSLVKLDRTEVEELKGIIATDEWAGVSGMNLGSLQCSILLLECRASCFIRLLRCPPNCLVWPH